MDVDRRHQRSASPPRTSCDDGLEILRDRVTRLQRRHELATRGVHARPCRARAGASPRRSTACAAITSAIAATRAPSSTCSASRRAPSGADVARSSMPSAWVALESSNETGCASSRASETIDCDRDPELGQTVVRDPELDGETLRQPGERPLQELHRALCRARQHRSKRDPDEIEGRRDRQRVEVPDGDDARAVPRDDERVGLMRVEVDASCANAKARASRAAPCTCGMQRKQSGSCRLRAAPSGPQEAAVERVPEASSRLVDQPADTAGRAASSGSSTERFAAKASRSSAATSSSESSSARGVGETRAPREPSRRRCG